MKASRFRSLTAALFAASALVTCPAADTAKGQAKAKNNNKQVGTPAFKPDLTQPAFEPGAVKPEALPTSSFVLPEGLELQLWAQSPLLHNPTNMDVDAAGRIWVAQGINYRRHSGRSREGDSIMVLEDSNGDGRADRSHAFVTEKELESPMGLAVFDNVILVSCAPHLIRYTDKNRDLKFDPAVDVREVLLTGFEQQQHDHSLHAVYAGPDGRWYFSNGNCGAMVSDRSGNTFRIGGAYLNNPYTGQKSDDGHVYVGGFTASMDPQGHGMRILGHGYRNSYEGVRNSLGDMFLNDNDDPPACRVSHLIEGGFFGFFSRDGKRQWGADKRPGQSVPTAEWRQDDPGSIPAGDVYGGGAPTGMAYLENGALGDRWRGLLLSCETGRNVVFGYQPKRRGAGMKLERFNFCTSNTSGVFKGSDFVGGSNNLSDESHTRFRPSDVLVGTDGTVYIADWYDKRTGGHQDTDETCSGAIYRVVAKGSNPRSPTLDYSSIAGCIEALSSPANNVRHHAFVKLREKANDSKAVAAVQQLSQHQDAHLAARAIWLLAQMGEAGIRQVRDWLHSEDAQQRLVALRALRAAEPEMIDLLSSMVHDADAAVRAEVAVALRDVPAAQARNLLVELAKRYDGEDRSYLEAWGLGCSGKESEVYQALTETFGSHGADWNPVMARLAWRLHPAEAVPALKQRASAESLDPRERRLALDALAFISDRSAADAVLDLAAEEKSPIRADALWWLIHRNSNDWSSLGVSAKMKERGLMDFAKAKLTSIETPPAVPNNIDLAQVKSLRGDVKRGQSLVSRCVMCHSIGGQGAEFGPNLQGWGISQPSDIIAEAIVNPNKDIAHGYDGVEVVCRDGTKIHGLLLSDGEVLMIRSMGGQTQWVDRSLVASRRKLGRSMMMSATQLGLSAQDVADLVAYLRQAE
jgi:putative membrane-bound dehydrogenase-like protein